MSNIVRASLCSASSSLASYVLSAYEMERMLSGRTIELNENGRADPASLAKICAGRIYSIFEIIDGRHLPSTLWGMNVACLHPSRFLVWYIEQIIREAPCSPTVTATALSLLIKYQCALVELDDVDSHTTDEVCSLFFAAYIAAARAAGEGRIDQYHTFWTRVSGSQYSGPQLAYMEQEFMKVVEWATDETNEKAVDECENEDEHADEDDVVDEGEYEDDDDDQSLALEGLQLEQETSVVWEEIEVEELPRTPPEVVWEEIEVEELERFPAGVVSEELGLVESTFEDRLSNFIGQKELGCQKERGIWLVASPSEAADFESVEEIPSVDADDERAFRNATLTTPKAKYQPRASASDALRGRLLIRTSSKQFNSS